MAKIEVDVEGLGSLRTMKYKVNKLLWAIDPIDKVLQKVCEHVAQRLRTQYKRKKNLLLDDVVVSYEMHGFEATIFVQGEQVSFFEFGTGEEGRDTYKGQLPTQPITFYSIPLHREHTTEGWVYSYANAADPTKAKWGGNLATNIVYYAARYLERNHKKIVRQAVEEIMRTRL